ncbi:CHAT domain-containing protein [Bradyrhizobium sp. 27S5]|uniref:CHAT domain-containing protein n=1 Tax=Bradyrhizobium sp. 27S5 TaxID=3139728 RepID=UPI0030CCED52
MAETKCWTWSLERGGTPALTKQPNLAQELQQESDELHSALISFLDAYAAAIFYLKVTRFGEGLLRAEGSIAAEQRVRDIEKVLVEFSSRHVLRFDNRMIVTAPFRSATPHDDAYEFGHARPKAKTEAVGAAIAPPPVSVNRFPVIRTDDVPERSKSFTFEVDLSMQRDAGTRGDEMTFADLPADWSSLDVDVEAFSSNLSFGPGEERKQIRIMRAGGSVSAKFEATVRADVPDEATNIEIVAMFSHGGRFSGVARRTLALKAPAKPEPQAPAASDAVPPSGAVAIVPGASAPELTIKIIGAGGEGKYLWSLEAPRGRGLGPASWSGISDMGRSTGDFALGLLKECPRLKPGQHANVLQGIGEDIWGATPKSFRDLYFQLRKKLGPGFPIQLVTDEPHVPWEMMHPDSDAGIDDADHLFMSHPISRWFISSEGRMPASFKPGSIASFVPDYTDGSGLPAAIDEGSWLVSNLSAVSMEATYGAFTKFWGAGAPSDPVAVLHFAGHGQAEDATNAKLKLLDGWVFSSEVNSKVKLGQRFGTFMVINACEVGASEYRLGLISGWAARLADQGFGGILAPLWAVQDEHASSVVRDYLRDFVGGQPVGQAMLKARVAHRDKSSTPYAYVCHGDVMASIAKPATS